MAKKSFLCEATVYKLILQDESWQEYSKGQIQFEYNLDTNVLYLITNVGTQNEMTLHLRARIRSKPPRGYAMTAIPQSANNFQDSTLAVMFETEERSQTFRRFIENIVCMH